MVHGLDVFRKYFENFKNQYVLIGGSACSIWSDVNGGKFRSTKDLDIVLILESLDTSFTETFFKFVNDGGYSHLEKGKIEFYRFKNPSSKDFPAMIELLSRVPDFLKEMQPRFAPIHVSDDVESLSAILLNDDYYALLQNNSKVENGVTLLNVPCLIVFKIRAHVDLSSKHNEGMHVNEHDLKKHKNDVLRLAAILDPSETMTLPQVIHDEVLQFLNSDVYDSINLVDLGIKGTSVKNLKEAIQNCFGMAGQVEN